MQGKEKLFDLGRIQTHDPTILINDGRNVLTIGQCKISVVSFRHRNLHSMQSNSLISQNFCIISTTQHRTKKFIIF